MNVLANWLRQPFRLLDTVRSRWKLIIFCGIFGCLFLNIFIPFNLNQWFNHVNAPLFVVLTFFPLAGMLALSLTQFVLRRLFNVQLATRGSFAVRVASARLPC